MCKLLFSLVGSCGVIGVSWLACGSELAHEQMTEILNQNFA